MNRILKLRTLKRSILDHRQAAVKLSCDEHRLTMKYGRPVYLGSTEAYRELAALECEAAKL